MTTNKRLEQLEKHIVTYKPTTDQDAELTEWFQNNPNWLTQQGYFCTTPRKGIFQLYLIES